jgi:hypothetical protein
MKAIIKTTVASLAICAMTGQSFAAEVCARPNEALALKTAAIQQELMVAALYCNDVRPYNHFVIGYRQELQQSDATLLNYFTRVQGSRGDAGYNAYKTTLANDFSRDGSRQSESFCAAADVVFERSSNGNLSLREFVSAQSVGGMADYPVCDERSGSTEIVRGGSSGGGE